MELSTIEFHGDKLPILCTMEILEQIQDEFGSITKFSERLIPVTPDNKPNGLPDMHAVVFTLPKFINEGIDVYNQDHKIKLEKMTVKEIFQKCDKSLLDVALAIYQEMWRSVNAPKQQPPAKTSRNSKAKTTTE